MEFAYVSIQGWIVDPYTQCFFYCSFEVLVFPPHYTEIINIDIMTSGVGMFKYLERCLLMFFEKALQRCKYPAWALNRLNIKSKGSANKKRRDTTQTGQNNSNQKPYMLVPYYRGLSKSLKKVCIKNLLVAPKDKDPVMKKSGFIYRYKCNRVYCDKEYIGEFSRVFGERFKEHQKAPSQIFEHTNTTGHNINIDNFSIVGREDQNLKRAIKEALCIRVNNPSLNRNIGKFHLPHIWDEVLFNTSEPKLN